MAPDESGHDEDDGAVTAELGRRLVREGAGRGDGQPRGVGVRGMGLGFKRRGVGDWCVGCSRLGRGRTDESKVRREVAAVAMASPALLGERPPLGASPVNPPRWAGLVPLPAGPMPPFL